MSALGSIFNWCTALGKNLNVTFIKKCLPPEANVKVSFGLKGTDDLSCSRSLNTILVENVEV